MTTPRLTTAAACAFVPCSRSTLYAWYSGCRVLVTGRAVAWDRQQLETRRKEIERQAQRQRRAS